MNLEEQVRGFDKPFCQPEGWVKLEIGDEVLTLTPQEDPALAPLQAGAAAPGGCH